MPPREPKPSTVKRLFALSRNLCAFPNCSIPIVEDSGVVTGIICHIKARNKGGPRYDSKQKAEDRHNFENLILLCSRHSKIIDSQPQKFSVDLLSEIKQIHEDKSSIELTKQEAVNAMRLLQDYRSIYIASGSKVDIHKADTINANTVNIKNGSKSPQVTAPEGSIASSLLHKNYTKHLIDRFNDFASKQQDRKFHYSVIYNNVKSTFGAKWDMIPMNNFEKLITYLQRRINNTMLGRINKSKGHSNYSDFNEYQSKYGNS